MNNSYDYLVELGGDYLEHHGVKGMKWGYRKSDRMFKKFMKRTKKIETMRQNMQRVHDSREPKFLKKIAMNRLAGKNNRKLVRLENKQQKVASKIYQNADNRTADKMLKQMRFLSSDAAAYTLGMNKKQKREFNRTSSSMSKKDRKKYLSRYKR